VVADLLLVEFGRRAGWRFERVHPSPWPVLGFGDAGKAAKQVPERVAGDDKLGGVGDEVPLVDDDDDGAAGLVRVAADVGVEGGDAFGGVEDEEGDVGGFEVLAGHDDGELLGHEVGLALAADAGGVDEAEVVAGAVTTSSTASRVVPAMG
jgi:hypothetical protein